MRILSTYLIILASFGSGCAHVQLCRQTSKQAETLTDLNEKQVLDNIARICANRGELPFFSVASGGSSQAARTGSLNYGLAWNARTFTGQTATLNGSANQTEAWTLSPINDPVKLNMMKCVYLYVTGQADEDSCHECLIKLDRYFGTDFPCCDVPGNWFSVSHCRPKEKACCCKWGEYCGTYVCVSADRFEYLSRVTSSILDLATVKSEDLAAKIAPPKEARVEIEQTFRTADGKQVITGKYSVPKSVFEKLKSGPSETELHDPEKERHFKNFNLNNSEIESALRPSDQPLRRETDGSNLELLKLPRN